MNFSSEYKQIKKNYRSLIWVENFILWMRFKITPLDKLLELFPESGKLLDLGCGFGGFSYFFSIKRPMVEILGVDPSERRIKTAEDVYLKPVNIKFIKGKIDDLSEGSFDAISLIDVTYLLSEQELVKTLKECYKKITPGGVLVLKTMNKARSFRYLFSIASPIFIKWLISLFGRKKTIEVFGSRENKPRYYRPQEEIKILESCGWKVVDVFDTPLKFLIYPNIIYFCKK
ncbi:MAG: methyltransferase domain-containing protein [Candidatus Portnoybacteria bacterium]|nr:methyltransferase domain-containing protein [Candidatus Portnoybacteria bacterium]